ncbi:MAG: protein phosphatase 2C domain-containing protein [Ruminococcaceae bacterium]|nr:protein phosphatase 2C domain-containing protein [Oscillospiraceae bacterium]
MILQKWKQCGTAVQGVDHIHAKVPCQDNVAAAAKNGVHAIALSDGGGSRKFSHVGSEYATRAACELLVERFEDYYSRLERIDGGDPKADKLLLRLRLEILDTVLDAMRTQVDAERTLYDFGCTLQFAAVKDGRYIAGHVGDGVIAAIYQRGLRRTVEVLSHPENAGAPNVTFFVTDHDAEAHLRLSHGECRQLEGILMMSDGPEEVLYSGAGGMHQNTQKLFDNFVGVRRAEYTAALQKFLTGNIAKHSFDDLSLNLLYLETVEWSKLSTPYRQELMEELRSTEQVERVSSYACFLDPSRKATRDEDLSFLRC